MPPSQQAPARLFHACIADPSGSTYRGLQEGERLKWHEKEGGYNYKLNTRSLWGPSHREPSCSSTVPLPHVPPHAHTQDDCLGLAQENQV